MTSAPNNSDSYNDKEERFTFLEPEKIISIGVKGKIDTNFTMTRLISNIEMALFAGNYEGARRGIEIGLANLRFYSDRIVKRFPTGFNLMKELDRLDVEIKEKKKNAQKIINAQERDNYLRELDFNFLIGKYTIMHHLMGHLSMKPELAF